MINAEGNDGGGGRKQNHQYTVPACIFIYTHMYATQTHSDSENDKR